MNIDRFVELGNLWDERPGDENRAGAFVDVCIDWSESLGIPYPAFRERLAAGRRAGLDWTRAFQRAAL